MTHPHNPTTTATTRDAAARVLARYPAHLECPDLLARICRDEGIEVRDADLHDIRGVLRREGTAWRIYLSRQDAPQRRVFTLAHLLGHYFLHADAGDAFIESQIIPGVNLATAS